MKCKNYLFMIVLGLMFISPVTTLKGQTDSLVNMPNLLLPKFTKSLILFKSGEQKKATINYNVVDEVMVFMQGKTFMVLDQPELIDTVYMANRKFVPVKNAFYEVILKEPVVLLKQHKSYTELEGYPTGYGAKSQTTAPNYVRQIYGANGAIDLKIPTGTKFTDDSRYWVNQNGQLSDFDSKRQFTKIFPGKDKEINDYLKKNSVDFKDTEKVKLLVVYTADLLKL
jgi:hypothetical protein